MPKTALAIAASLLAASSLAAQERPRFNPDGSVEVPAFNLPPSVYLSPEALAAQKDRAKPSVGAPPTMVDIATSRARLEAGLAPQVARMREVYPADVAEARMGGVRVRVVTPKDKPFNRKRVLINLHGGAFSVCAEACAMLESVPISALGGFKVVTVDYRMAPEHRHPAGVEDVAAVYRELLKTYKPLHIGIYGCSAGGALTGHAGAWLPAQGLPRPGALGIFGAGAVRFGAGDSSWIAAAIDGSFPAPARAGQPEMDMTRGYFTGSDMAGPDVSPALHPEVLRQFPPTLVITGTRAMDMSPAIVTNSALLKAGVRSTLIVAEGMGHCFIYQPDLPESRDAHQAIVSFFRETLR